MAHPEFIEVQEYLAGVSYPASKQELVQHAKSSGATGDVIEALQSLPDREYDGPNQVSGAVATV